MFRAEHIISSRNQLDYIEPSPPHRPKGTEPTVMDPTTQLVYESTVFEVNMRTSGANAFTPKSTDECLSYRCCQGWCNLFFSPMEVMQIRGAFIRSLKDKLDRVDITDAVVAFIYQRLELPVNDIDDELFSVKVRRRFFDKTVCQSFFVDVLGLTDSKYLRIVRDIATGQSFVSHRKGASNRLGESTCRAIARVAVHLDLHGQYNPMGAHIMLGRGEEKLFFLRTNSTGSALDEGVLKKFTDLSIRRRGVDSFMRCDACLTLSKEFDKLVNLLRMTNEQRPTKSRRDTSYTQETFNLHIRSKRKAVLYQLFQRYRNCRKARLEDSENTHGVGVDDVVADDDVETSRYCYLLNQRPDRSLAPFQITEEMIQASELLELDEDSIELYLSGVLGPDFSIGQNADDARDGDPPVDDAARDGDPPVDDAARDGDPPVDDAARDEDPPVDHPMTSGGAKRRLTGRDLLDGVGVGDFFDGDDPSVLIDCSRAIAEAARLLPVKDVASRMRAGLLTALERIVALRKFHNEHVTCERVISYSAFEVAAKNSMSCMTFAADGLSKDKTKLPNKEKGKNDETVNRLECFVTGLQMSIPQQVAAKPLTKSQNRAERSRRHQLELRRRAMLKDPQSFTDEEKLEVDRMLTEVADRDVSAASGFSLINHDFLYPYGCGGAPRTDALISNILHVLRSDQVAFLPSCIALVLDNASVNKSVLTLRAFAVLLELIPRLREVHLLFPSVGHTHNSVDAHFGTVCEKIKRVEIGTPQDLANCLETLESTRAYIDFGYYQFADGLASCCDALEFKYLSQQHHFLLFRDDNGDVLFNNKAFLRFAEPLSHRINNVLAVSRDLIPLTQEEMATGTPVFALGQSGRDDRVAYAKTIFPAEKDHDHIEQKSSELWHQLQVAGIATAQRKRDLESLHLTEVPAISLYDLCRELNNKSPVAEDEQVHVGTDQELALAMFLRMRGRPFRSSDMSVVAANAHAKAKSTVGKTLIDVLLEGDDGSLVKMFLAKLEVNEKRKGGTKFPQIIGRLKAMASGNAGVDEDNSDEIGRDDDDLMAMPGTPEAARKRRRVAAPKIVNKGLSAEMDEDDAPIVPDPDDQEEAGDDDEDDSRATSSRGRRITARKPYTPNSHPHN